MTPQKKVGQAELLKLKRNGVTPKNHRILVRKAAGIVAMAALRRHGITQTKIAQFLGTTQASVSNTMNGVVTPSLRTLTKLDALTTKLNIDLPEISEWREL